MLGRTSIPGSHEEAGERPRLELSGPALKSCLETLVAGSQLGKGLLPASLAGRCPRKQFLLIKREFFFLELGSHFLPVFPLFN